MNNWAIMDDNGIIESGNYEEMQFIWACNTRTITDLYNEYTPIYTKKQVKYWFSKHQRRWTGDLKLIEIHNVTR